MIKTFIDKLIDKATGGHTRKRQGKRVEFGPQAHGINPDLVDERAVTVVNEKNWYLFCVAIVNGTS